MGHVDRMGLGDRTDVSESYVCETQGSRELEIGRRVSQTFVSEKWLKRSVSVGRGKVWLVPIDAARFWAQASVVEEGLVPAAILMWLR